MRTGSFRVALGAILLLAAVLRLWAVEFGLPGKYRPDEEYLVSRALGFHSGNLNPRFFQYPTLYMYGLSGVYGLYRAVGAAAGTFGADGFHGYLRREQYAPLHLVGRCTTAALGIVTVWVTFRLAAEAFDPTTGLLSAAVLAVNFSHVRDSHFVTTDVPMTLMIVLALHAILAVATRGRPQDYLGAGALVGLATSVKYPAIALLVPLGAVFSTRIAGRRALAEVRLLLGSGIYVLCFFLFGSPYALLDWPTFLDAFDYQAGFVKSGLPEVAMPHGLRWLLSHGLWYGAGPGIECLGLLGLGGVVMEALRGGWRRGCGVALATFFVGACAALVGSRLLFLRYIVPLMPVLSIFAAHLVLALARLVVSGRAAVVLSVAVLALASIDPAARAVASNRLLTAQDTRNSASRWIEENLPAGAKIATRTRHMYGKPQPSGYRFVDLEQVAAQEGESGVDWVLIDEHPLSFYSPAPDDKVRRFLATHGRLVVKFDPFVGHSAASPIYDPPDAFYVPLAGFEAVREPGPVISIYRLK